MQTFQVKFLSDAVIDDKRVDTIYRFEAGSKAALPLYLVGPLLLEANPPIRLLSPVQLRPGFQVKWCDAERCIKEGRLLMQLNRFIQDRVEKWLLVDQVGQGVLIPQSQVVEHDPAPLIAALRQAYHSSQSDDLPLFAESVLGVILRREGIIDGGEYDE